jgi:hypothetical protein
VGNGKIERQCNRTRVMKNVSLFYRYKNNEYLTLGNGGAFFSLVTFRCLRFVSGIIEESTRHSELGDHIGNVNEERCTIWVDSVRSVGQYEPHDPFRQSTQRSKYDKYGTTPVMNENVCFSSPRSIGFWDINRGSPGHDRPEQHCSCIDESKGELTDPEIRLKRCCRCGGYIEKSNGPSNRSGCRRSNAKTIGNSQEPRGFVNSYHLAIVEEETNYKEKRAGAHDSPEEVNHCFITTGTDHLCIGKEGKSRTTTRRGERGTKK